MDCSKMAQGLVAANCASAELPGTGSSVYLFSYSDIDRDFSVVGDLGATVSGEAVTLHNVISGITLNTGKLAYIFESIEDSHVGEVSLAKGQYYNEFDHSLSLRVFAKTAEAKAFINQLKGSRVVCVIQSKAKDVHDNCGDIVNELETWALGEYEAYGWDAGLIATEVTASTDIPDNVVYSIKLASSDIAKEQTLPKIVFDTTEGTGLAILTNLLS